MTVIIDEAADIDDEEWRHMSDAIALTFSHGAVYQGPVRDKGDSLADRLLSEWTYWKAEDKS